MTSKAQQIELDNALVAPENHRVIGKCNMRINPGMKPKEPTYQVTLDALALTTCYLAFLITTEVSVIYMHQFWATVIKHKSSYQFKIDKKRFSVNVEVLREILNICPKVPGKEFDEPPTEEEALSFIRELGHSGEIRYITDVVVDHLHQPWRTFASIINKCLCGKVSGLDKIRLSRVQILWGMYYKKNLDFVALIWEDLAYQIDNIDSKKQDKMLYPRFTKIIIHHFLTKDKSISWRNKMFMNTARDDSVLGTDDKYLHKFIDSLNKMFSLKDLGDLSFFLGLQITRSKTGLTLSQKAYIKDILNRSNMSLASPMSTPADPYSKLQKEGDPFSDPTLYRQVVGSLQYATNTRPDISYSVNRVCQYMHSPTNLHRQAVKRILRYLNGTLHHCLHFKPTKAKGLHAFSDSSWNSDIDDSRSQYGFAIFHGANLISWTSRKQKVVARSSTEAEYRSLAYTTAELMWLKLLISDLCAPYCFTTLI
ncbi:retrovirus-related pol polyprotein from transposon TNT 1-94 [Tanacetum coccineum]